MIGDLGDDYSVIKSNANPFRVSITPDNTVAYVTMRFGAGLAAVDLLTWKEIDTDQATAGINTIKFNNAPKTVWPSGICRSERASTTLNFRSIFL